MIKNIFKSNKGITLIELLASLALVTVIGIAVYSVLFGGLKTFNKIMDENELRDEGDVIMAYLINDFYTLKASDIQKIKLPEEGTNDYYIIKTNGTRSGIIGSEIILNDRQITLNNDNVILTNGSTITQKSPTSLEITLVLRHERSNKELKLTSTLSIVNDRREG
ncbi:PulJ/GspJ family protein [Neobacillus sp. K501]